MKLKINAKGFSAIEQLVVLIVIALIGIAGVYVYQSQNDSNTNKKASTNAKNTVNTETDCFIAQVPEEYKIVAPSTPNPQGCQYAAHTGKDTKNPESLIAVLPFKSLVNTGEEARVKLQEQVPNAKNIKSAKVGGYDAVGTEGYSSSGADGKEKFVRTFVVYSPKQYPVNNGEYSANAFMVSLILLPEDASQAYDILGIKWK